MGIELDIRGNVLCGNDVLPSDAPEFWSVYRDDGEPGCWMWLADFPTRAEAEWYAEGLCVR